MTEWGVVLVIIALTGFVIAIIKTVAPLISSITALNCSVKTLSEKIDSVIVDDKAQNEKIEDHEIRIVKLENR